jgi:hypothetical protein
VALEAVRSLLLHVSFCFSLHELLLLAAFGGRMGLENAIKKLRALKTFDVKSAVAEIIIEHSEFISDLLAMQLARGLDGDNEPVFILRNGKQEYTYSYFTKELKEKYGTGLGKETRWITNYSSGAFYKELFVTVNGAIFDIKSRVPYFQKILSRSGSRIMELNQEHLEILRDQIIVPEIRKRYEIYLNAI